MIILVKVMDVSSYDSYLICLGIKQHITETSKVVSFRNVTKEEISLAIKTLSRKKPLYFTTCLPKSFSSLVKLLLIFSLITSVVA